MPGFFRFFRIPSDILSYAAMMAILEALIAMFGCVYMCGCVYKGAKVTEGVDFSAGISLPASEGVAQVSFVNYLSGFRLGVAENSATSCEFWGTNRFDLAWGLYSSENFKHFKAKIEPCEITVTNSAPLSVEKKED